MRKGLAAITDWRIGGWFAAIWPSVLLGVAVSVLTLLSTRADAQLPGSAATGNQFNTMPQEVQTVLVDARQTYRDALSGDPCDPKIRAYIDHLNQLLKMAHDIEVGASDLRDQMRQNQANILTGLSGLIPGFDLMPDTAGSFGTGAVAEAVKEAANALAESADVSLGPAGLVKEAISKFDELNEKQKLDQERQAILRDAEYQAAQIGLVNLTIDGARAAEKEISDEIAQLLGRMQNCDQHTANVIGSGGLGGGSSGGGGGGVDVIPGNDVAKGHLILTDTSTQHNIPGGHIVVIPDDPAQPIKQADINPTGTTEIPPHGPNDTVEIIPTCHVKVDLTGSAFDGANGLSVSVPSKPVTITFIGTKASEITRDMVNEAVRGQYPGVSLGSGDAYTTEQHGVDFPVTVVTVNKFQAVSAGGPVLDHCPATTTPGGTLPGGTTTGTTPEGPTAPDGPTTPGGGVPSYCTGGDCTPTGPGVCTGGDCTPCPQCTTTDGGHIAEGNIPMEIQGPAPNDPLALSTGSWGQRYRDQWWLSAIDWLKADGSTVLPTQGAPVIVAIIDTGVDYTHPDLAGALWVNPKRKAGDFSKDADGRTDDLFGWNFVDNNNDVRDRNGHGTVIAGIIAARSGKGFGIAGIDPWARIMPLKAMETDGQGGSVNVTKAIYYAVDHGARVINLSVGGERISLAEQAALNYAAKKDVLIVVASGNEGVDTADWSPSGLRHALVVAAVDPELKRPTFSNWGANIALAAPGVDILSLRARQTDLLIFSRKDYKPGTAVVKGSYYRVTGSSFSAPMVTGAVALLLSTRPQLTAEQVTRILEQTARNLSGIGNDQFTGYGLIDIDAALNADPGAYVDAAITEVGVAQANGRTVVRVTGTASADRLREAYIEIGVGDAPTSWKRVSRAINASVTGGVLDDLDPSVFAGSKEWTLRVVAVNQNGKQREARYKLSLG